MTRLARLTFAFLISLAAVRLSVAQVYAISYGLQSQGPGRRLQQVSFSPFDSSPKLYGYSAVERGRHLLDGNFSPEEDVLLEEQSPTRSLLQAYTPQGYSPAAYAANSLGLHKTQGSTRRRLHQSDIGNAVSIPVPAYGGYGGPPHKAYGQRSSYGGYGGF